MVILSRPQNYSMSMFFAEIEERGSSAKNENMNI